MPSQFAIIETGGKQYRVSPGQKIRVEKLSAGGAGAIVFDKVLLRSEGGRAEIGTPYVSGAKVEAKLLGNFRGEKKIVFKYHSKTRFRKKKGHRQEQSFVEVGAM